MPMLAERRSPPGNEREAIPAQAGGEVGSPQRALEHGADSAERSVTSRMAAGVVEPLHPVEVDHQERQRAIVTARAPHGLAEVGSKLSELPPQGHLSACEQASGQAATWLPAWDFRQSGANRQKVVGNNCRAVGALAPNAQIDERRGMCRRGVRGSVLVGQLGA
jgi:hypothetical protein